MEKTSTPHKPVLRSPQKPLSCMSPAGPPEAHLLGKMPCSPGLPDNIPKGVPTPRLEGSNSYSQDFPLRSRVSLSKIGRRLSVSDEACFGLSLVQMLHRLQVSVTQSLQPQIGKRNFLSKCWKDPTFLTLLFSVLGDKPAFFVCAKQ
ncbi:hypothetical protein E2320_013756, partial [Naja naja]